MRTIYAIPGKTICIGIQGENRAAQVMIPLCGLSKDNHEKEYKLIVQLQAEKYYPELTEISADGKYLIWIPTLDDLNTVGTRKAEIEATGENSVEISETYTFTVEKSVEYYE